LFRVRWNQHKKATQAAEFPEQTLYNINEKEQVFTLCSSFWSNIGSGEPVSLYGRFSKPVADL